MSNTFPPVRAIRIAQPKDALHTVILGSGFVSSLFLPTYLIQILSIFPPKFQTAVIDHRHSMELIFFMLGAWLAVIALRFATHLEIRQKNSSNRYIGPMELVVVAGAAFVLYKYLSDRMIDDIRKFWSPEPGAMSLSELLQIWIIWWSILLGYIAKVPWDRAKQLLQDPFSIGSIDSPVIAGRWSLLYSTIMPAILIFQIIYATAFPPTDRAIIRAKSVRQIAIHECAPAKRDLMILAADGRVNDDEKDVAITIISNARARTGLSNCTFNPKALR